MQTETVVSTHVFAIVTLVVVAFLVPFLWEYQKPKMSAEMQAQAPGAIAKLPSGATHYQWFGPMDGQVMVFFVITVAACEAAVGLAMVIALYRKYGTVDTNFLRMLRG